MNNAIVKYWPNGNVKSIHHKDAQGATHNPDGPAIREWYENGQLRNEEYYLNALRHNPNGPAYREWWENGQINYESYFIHGRRHNPNGPAIRTWDRTGQLHYEAYYLNGVKTTPPCDDKIIEVDGIRYKLVRA